jgi:hypothetical protein
MRDRSLEDSEGLPPPGVLAGEFAEDLQAALARFVSITLDLRDEVTGAGTGKKERLRRRTATGDASRSQSGTKRSWDGSVPERKLSPSLGLFVHSEQTYKSTGTMKTSLVWLLNSQYKQSRQSAPPKPECLCTRSPDGS